MKKGKLKERNNWESLSYTFDGEPIKAKDISKVLVRWPDKKETAEEAQSVKRTESYSDHGHTSTVTSDELRVLLKMNGQTINVPARSLNIVGVEA